ncbi:MAG: rod shape-determining protein MreC [Endomicrobium sp.]|jgi:rod shape-determining protein MreC|nr:rod shape-determining protein MreC [Endomicrobium sp.]
MCQRRKSKKENVVFAVLLLIGFSFIICGSCVPVNLVKTFVYYVAYPSVGTANCIFRFTGNLAENIKAMVHLHQENIMYKQINKELNDKLRNYDLMVKEYENVSEFLKLGKIENTVLIFAEISVREPHEWYQWLIIDKGEDDGLYNDLPVAMLSRDKGALYAVGRIVETYKTSSKVALITNSNCVFPVEIKDKGINCLAEGFGSNLLKITYIPFGANVKPEDEIVVSELSSVFQKGMAVGVIRDVMEETTDDFKTATGKVFFEDNILYKAIILVPQKKTK